MTILSSHRVVWRIDDILDFYLGVAFFEYCVGEWLSWVLSYFSSVLRANVSRSGVLRSVYDTVFQIIIRLSSHHSILHSRTGDKNISVPSHFCLKSGRLLRVCRRPTQACVQILSKILCFTYRIIGSTREGAHTTSQNYVRFTLRKC
jgi:hypothetical protein